MNAAARTLSHGNLFKGDFSSIFKGDFKLLPIILWAAVILSALAVVYVRHVERTNTFELTQVVKENAQLKVEGAQLMLEKSMWASPSRIQRLAKHRLNMEVGVPKAIVFIKE